MRRPTYPPECGEFRPIGAIATEIVADLKFRRQVIRLHRQGPRAVGEFLAGLGAELGVQTPIERKLDTFAELEPDTLQAVGGNEFWQPPLRGVER